MKLLKNKKIWLLIILCIFFALVKIFRLENYLTFTYLQHNLFALKKEFFNHPTFFTLGFFTLYVLSTAFSIPGATLLTLLAGAILGLWRGVVFVSFASTLGATLAFLLSRYLLRDSVQKKFTTRLKTINEGIKKEGAFYLFTLRLIPVFPFFVINLLMGLTPLKTWTFLWVSQLGMLAGTLVYVNAGQKLSELSSLKGLLSPNLMITFSLIGLLPMIGKRIIAAFKRKQVYRSYKRPKKYDYNMVVIGAGAAGLVTSYIAAAVKAKVALIEKHKMGGDCLNTGCVPSKALIQSAKMIFQAGQGEKFGLSHASPQFSFETIMQRLHKIIKKIEPHDSIERYTKLGVDCFSGEAQILSPFEVKIGEKILTTRNITIATGAAPLIPPLKGIEKITALTSENLWSLQSLPKKMVILGGGPIGVELAQAFQRLGSQVSLVEGGSRLLKREDAEVSNFLQQKLQQEGVKLYLSHSAEEILEKDSQKLLKCSNKISIAFDEILIAVGRKANTQGFGLEKLKVNSHHNGTLEVNEFLETKFPNIFACGDVAGPYQFTHTAAHQAWYCAINGLFGSFKKFKVDYSVIPWCTYVDPEIARVGLNEQEALEQNIPYEVTTYDFAELDRAITESHEEGWIKVLTIPGKDKILGTTVVGQGASTLITEFILAMKYNLGLNKILATIHIYPSWGEANKYVAGNWKKNHAPEKTLKWIEKFHRWKR